MLREQLDQANSANQALSEDIRRVTSDWTRSCKELEQREATWRREEEVSGASLQGFSRVWRGTGSLTRVVPARLGAGLGHTCPGPGWPVLLFLVKCSVTVACRVSDWPAVTVTPWRLGGLSRPWLLCSSGRHGSSPRPGWQGPGQACRSDPS